MGRARFPGLAARSREGRICLASERRLDVPENVGGPLRGRLLKRSWPVRLVLVAALLLAVSLLFHAGSPVHAADNDVTGVTADQPQPGRARHHLGRSQPRPRRLPRHLEEVRRPSGPHTGTKTPSRAATPSRRARPTRCRISKRAPHTRCGCAPATTTATTTSRRAVPGRTRARQVGNSMINLRAVFSITAGLIFGLVWVWQGIAAAFIVVAFAVLGWLIGLAVWVGGRAASGDIDMSTVRQLISTLFSDTRRSR